MSFDKSDAGLWNEVASFLFFMVEAVPFLCELELPSAPSAFLS